MVLRPLCLIVLMLAASPAAAADSAVRLFAPAPKAPAPTEQSLVERAPDIRLFAPVSHAAKPDLPSAPAIRGPVRENNPSDASPEDRGWTVALP